MNYNNNRDQQYAELLVNDFEVVTNKKTIFKTVNSKDNSTHDLFEFWVLDNNEEIHCIAWDNVANSLKNSFENGNFDTISLTYRKRLNKFTGNTDYSVQKYQIK